MLLLRFLFRVLYNIFDRGMLIDEVRMILNMDPQNEESIQKRATAFEIEIIKLLKNLDFKDVNGGASFKIGGIQVDVCGGHEDTLLVIECTTAKEKEEKYVRDKLRKLRGDIPILSKGFHKEPQYQKYTKVKYILATGNLELEDVDKDFANEPHKIYLWDHRFIEYYQNLYTVIGSATRYNLLGEMGVEPRTKSLIQVPAWTTRMSNYTVYLFFIEPQRLLQASYVARREIGNEKYYQRILQKTRISRIKEFLKKGKSFPNSIVVAFNKPPDFTPYPEIGKQYPWWPDGLGFGCLTFPANYRSCWIIDGQHRLYSFSDIHTSAKISVVAFHKLPLEKQAEYFIEINREQKPVEADLLWDLQGAMDPRSDDGIISNVVRKLNQSAPLESKIYVPLAGRKARKQLKFSGICLSIQKTHLIKERSINMTAAQKNPLYSGNPEQIVERVSKAIAVFLQGIDAIFKGEDKDEFMFTNVGVKVMIELFEVILAYKNRIPSTEDTNKYLEALHMHFEMEHPEKTERGNLRKIGSSEAGRRMILVEFVNGVRDLTGEKAFAPRIPAHDEFSQKIIGFERKLATFVFAVLNIQSEQDLLQYASPNICGVVISRYKSAVNAGEMDSKLCDYLTLGECKDLILDKKNQDKFKQIFVAPKSGFSKKEELEGALESLTSQRAVVLHGRVRPQKYKQQELLNIYIEKIAKCIDEYQSTS
jgi:DGQHR domain-containing protein